MRSFLGTWLLIVWLFSLSTGEAGAATRSGIGLQVVPIVSGELVVLQVIPDSPAYRSGIHPGDLLIEVGGRRMAGSDFSEIAPQALWGSAGTEVLVTYRRPGVSGERSVLLTRTELTAAPEALPGVKLLQPSQDQKMERKP